MKATVTHDPFGDVHDGSDHLNDSSDRNNGWAIASLGLALLSWTAGWLICCVPAFFSLPAVITGHIAQRPSFPISRLTLWGLILGYLNIAAMICLWSVWVITLWQTLPEAMEQLAEMAAESSNELADDWVGKPAPDLTVTTLSGESITLSDLKGRRVILDFWATWCPPCVQEIPHFVQLSNEFNPQELFLIGISDEDVSTLQSFRNEHNMNYPVASAVLEQSPYQDIQYLPTTFFLDEKGIIQQIFTGYHDYEGLKKAAFQPSPSTP